MHKNPLYFLFLYLNLKIYLFCKKLFHELLCPRIYIVWEKECQRVKRKTRTLEFL